MVPTAGQPAGEINWVRDTCQGLEEGRQKPLATEHWHKSLVPERNCVTMQVSRFRSAECGAVYQFKIQTQKPRQRFSHWNWFWKQKIKDFMLSHPGTELKILQFPLFRCNFLAEPGVEGSWQIL